MGMNKVLRKTGVKIIKLLLIQAIFLSLLEVCFYNDILAGNRLCDISISAGNNRAVPLQVEIADTYDSRQTGLMYRRELKENSGMLFVFENESRLNFWMKNTYIPLSIAYIDKTGIIKEIIYMKPLDISLTYPSSVPVMYAIEVNAGWFKKNNITAGCRINLNGCLGK